MLATLVLLPTLLLILVIAAFIYALFRANRRTHKLAPVRQEVMQKPILYRRAHPMKYLLNDRWSMTTLAAMELIVTEGGVGMANRIRGVSDVLGSQWWARSLAFEVKVERIAKAPFGGRPDWVVVKSEDDRNPFEVAILPRDHLDQILTALREAGAR